MKFIMTSILVGLMVISFGQQGLVTREREYVDSSGKYLVKYTYDLFGGGSVPATYPEGQLHMDATIEVFRYDKCRCINPEYQLTLIGEPFNGQYIEAGCFEDRPEDMVAKAKILQLGIIARKKRLKE